MNDDEPYVRPILHAPVIVTDGGPWAEHDMACAVCHVRSAVIELDTGIFQPCWSCQRQGYLLRFKLHKPRRGRVPRPVPITPSAGDIQGTME